MAKLSHKAKLTLMNWFARFFGGDRSKSTLNAKATGTSQPATERSSSREAIRKEIWNHVSPYNTDLAGPEAIVALGEDAVPEIIDIFSNPLHSSGQGYANQALLAICLDIFASQGSRAAGDFLVKIARGGVAVSPDSNGSTAERIAHNYVQ